ncbi:MAG: hypothetical protein V1744_03580 [Candidatus Altiarchaeota archaeon]
MATTDYRVSRDERGEIKIEKIPATELPMIKDIVISPNLNGLNFQKPTKQHLRSLGLSLGGVGVKYYTQSVDGLVIELVPEEATDHLIMELKQSMNPLSRQEIHVLRDLAEYLGESYQGNPEVNAGLKSVLHKENWTDVLDGLADLEERQPGSRQVLYTGIGGYLADTKRLERSGIPSPLVRNCLARLQLESIFDMIQTPLGAEARDDLLERMRGKGLSPFRGRHQDRVERLPPLMLLGEMSGSGTSDETKDLSMIRELIMQESGQRLLTYAQELRGIVDQLGLTSIKPSDVVEICGGNPLMVLCFLEHGHLLDTHRLLTDVPREYNLEKHSRWFLDNVRVDMPVFELAELYSDSKTQQRDLVSPEVSVSVEGGKLVFKPKND